MPRNHLQRLSDILTLPCEKHRQYQARRLDGRLAWDEWLAMSGHWIACGPCRRVVKELRRLDRVAIQISGDTPDRLSASARQRIARAIASADGRSHPED